MSYFSDQVKSFTGALIRKTLEDNDYDISKTAKILGIPRVVVYNRVMLLKKMNTEEFICLLKELKYF